MAAGGCITMCFGCGPATVTMRGLLEPVLRRAVIIARVGASLLGSETECRFAYTSAESSRGCSFAYGLFLLVVVHSGIRHLCCTHGLIFGSALAVLSASSLLAHNVRRLQGVNKRGTFPLAALGRPLMVWECLACRHIYSVLPMA